MKGEFPYEKSLVAYEIDETFQSVKYEEAELDMLANKRVYSFNGQPYRMLGKHHLQYLYSAHWTDSGMGFHSQDNYPWRKMRPVSYEVTVKIEDVAVHSMENEGQLLAIDAIDRQLEKLNQNLTFNKPHYETYLRDTKKVEALLKAKADIKAIPTRKEQCGQEEN